MNEGVIYVATGERFFTEAEDSLKSLRTHMPNLPAILWTDMAPHRVPSIFDEVQPIGNPQHSFADKIKPLALSPFEKSLFLDTDTRICHSLEDVFQLLNHFDIAAAHAPMRITWPQPEIPDSFVEVNSGFLAWRRSNQTNHLFSEWERLYLEHVHLTGQKDDQPSLRKALFASQLRLFILPPEYNFRTVLPGFCGRGVVKVIHGRHQNLPAIEQRLNRCQGCRVVIPSDLEFVSERFIILNGNARWLLAPFLSICSFLQKMRKLLTKWKRRVFD